MFAPIPLKIMRRTDLSANAKLLYARLILFVGENDTAWPSRETLANELGIHLASVKRAINELSLVGLIERQQQRGRTNEYRLLEEIKTNVAHIRAGSNEVTRHADEPPGGTDMSHRIEPIKTSTKKESARGQGSEDKKGKRGSRITEDWRPDEATRKRCVDKTSEPYVDEQIQCFINYWIDIAGQRGIKLAWDRAFSNWIGNEIKWGRYQSSSTGKPSGEEGRERRRSGLADAYSERVAGTGRTDTVH